MSGCSLSRQPTANFLLMDSSPDRAHVYTLLKWSVLNWVKFPVTNTKLLSFKTTCLFIFLCLHFSCLSEVLYNPWDNGSISNFAQVHDLVHIIHNSQLKKKFKCCTYAAYENFDSVIMWAPRPMVESCSILFCPKDGTLFHALKLPRDKSGMNQSIMLSDGGLYIFFVFIHPLFTHTLNT